LAGFVLFIGGVLAIARPQSMIDFFSDFQGGLFRGYAKPVAVLLMSLELFVGFWTMVRPSIGAAPTAVILAISALFHAWSLYAAPEVACPCLGGALQSLDSRSVHWALLLICSILSLLCASLLLARSERGAHRKEFGV